MKASVFIVCLISISFVFNVCLMSGFLVFSLGAVGCFCIGSRLVVPTLYRILSCRFAALACSVCFRLFSVVAVVCWWLYRSVLSRLWCLHSLSVEVLLLFMCGTSNGSYVSSMWSLIEYLAKVRGWICFICSGTSVYSSEYL